jgi:hypothetical protein
MIMATLALTVLAIYIFLIIFLMPPVELVNLFLLRNLMSSQEKNLFGNLERKE